MRISLDPESPEHPYVQLARLLREAIESGEIGRVVPSIMEITEQTGLAVGTVRRAIRILTSEGLVYTVPGRGTFTVNASSARRNPGQT